MQCYEMTLLAQLYQICLEIYNTGKYANRRDEQSAEMYDSPFKYIC